MTAKRLRQIVKQRVSARCRLAGFAVRERRKAAHRQGIVDLLRRSQITERAGHRPLAIESDGHLVQQRRREDVDILHRRVHGTCVRDRQIAQSAARSRDVRVVDVIADKNVVLLVEDVLHAEEIRVFGLRGRGWRRVVDPVRVERSSIAVRIGVQEGS